MQYAKRSPSPHNPRSTSEHESPKKAYPFSHHKLDVYRVALQMAQRSHELAAKVPRGYRSFADHLQRAAGQNVLLIAEGANRYSTGQKRQRYSEARGESGEVAAAAELLATLHLIAKADAEDLIHLAGRVAAMLTRLIQRYR
jgi:four helix bundle protein